jgi:hypothetical protein
MHKVGSRRSRSFSSSAKLGDFPSFRAHANVDPSVTPGLTVPLPLYGLFVYRNLRASQKQL